MRRVPVISLFLVLAVFIADQGTKYWALKALFWPKKSIELSSFVNLVPVWNTGISFGLLAGYSDLMPLIIIVTTIGITICLVVWLFITQRKILQIGLSLIIGGALGNIVDRIKYNAVIDFIDIHVASFHWPAFNIADSLITIGVCLFLIDNFVIKD